MNNNLQLKIMVGFAALAMGVSDSDALSYEAATGRNLAVTNHPVVIAHRDDLSKGRLCPEHLSNGAGINIADPSAQKFRIQSRVSSDENIIVEENFDLWEDGTESAPEYAGNLEGYYADSNCFDVLPDRMMHGGHWAGIGLCSAGGSLGLTYPRYGGYIQTPMGNYSGELHITARARVLEGQQVDAAALIITVAKENWNNPVPVGGSDYYTMFAIPNDGEWHDIEWIYANNYGGDDCFVQFNTYSMLLLDDLKISSVLGELPKPELLPATDFTYDGFTANWKEVTLATDYLLTCWRNIVTDDTPITITESFEGINHSDGQIDVVNPNYPVGWEFDFGEQEPQLFISDDNLEGNALKLTASGQTVTTPSTGSLITSLSFKMRFIGTPEIFTDPESGEVIFINVPGYFDLSGWDGYQWSRFGSAYVDPSGCDTFVEVDLTKHVAGKYLRLQLRAKGLGEDATLAIDDFKIETEPAISPEYVFDNEPVAATSYKFTGLDPASDYYYSVIARNTDLGIDSGEAGDAIFAFGLPAIEVLPPSEIDLNGEYKANWVASPKAQEYEVENFKVYTASEDMTDFNILEDAFSYVDYGFSTENPYSFNNMELINLDYYCDNPGWVGYMCGLADHAIGGIGSAVYGVSGQLQTPFMCLNNNNGKFKVTLSVCGTPGDYLCVVNTAMSGLAIPLTSEYEEHTIELENGALFDYLTFYTSNAFPFFINYISVDQDLKKGDKALISNNTIFTDQNYYKFNGLNEIDENHSYAYTVYGIHKSLSKSVYSPRSEVVYVDTNFTGVKEMDDSEYSAVAFDGNILVETRDDILTRIFSAEGVLISEFHGSALTAVPNGIYLVNANGKTMKLMVH